MLLNNQNTTMVVNVNQQKQLSKRTRNDIEEILEFVF